MKTLTRLLSAAAAAVMVAAPATAESLRFGYGHPPGSYFDKGAQSLAGALKELTAGELEVETFPLSLVSLAETSDGLESGIANVGALMTTMFPAEYPHANLTMEVSMILQLEDGMEDEKQGVLYAAAMTDFILNKCPECNDEFAAKNNVFTSGAASTPYALNCRKPVNDLADMAGARLRISGGYWSRWSQAVGATPVTMSGNEMLEALSQGVIDCIVLSVPDVFNFGMGDLVTDITIGVPGGIYVASFSQVNKDTWAGLSVKNREAFLRAAAVGAADISMMYENGMREKIRQSEAGEIPIKFHRPTEALAKASREFVEKDIATLVAYFAEKHSVTRGDEMVSDLRELVTKWRGLVRDVTTPEELADLYWTEIFAKVDLEKHGL
ncbi:MAG: C4-dicarboxylate TRAP transporter substrate-binding protein [Gemmobacter sp.]|nr:C4-dicarboxylate TRAP transporter substrate-binding protein [Gemmobacter sp.]